MWIKTSENSALFEISIYKRNYREVTYMANTKSFKCHEGEIHFSGMTELSGRSQNCGPKNTSSENWK